MEVDRKRHCWECLRRSLVCDFTRPECNRCTASEVPCPGYNEKEPVRLKWLAPGLVKSRKRKTTSNKDETSPRSSKELSSSPQSVASPCYEIKTDVHAFYEATEYYNTRIYPELSTILELGTNKGVYHISPETFQKGMSHPDYVRLSIVCMSLSHRMNQTRDNPEYRSLAKTYLCYRGLIIRSLNADIDVEHKRTNDLVIAGILTLLIVESQQGPSPYWRYHLEGARKIIMMRGGMRSVSKSTGIAPLLLFFVFIAVIGDTSSPASDMAMAPSHLEELYFVIEQYGDRSFAFQAIPTPLFAEILKINHLRMRACKVFPLEAEDFTCEAFDILSRVQTFLPEGWVESKPSSKREEWLLIGNIFQAAVALYCISSLQSLSVFPLTIFLTGSCTAYGQNLYTLLKKAVKISRIKRFMLWPLVVLGVGAVNSNIAMRSFVQEQLSEMSLFTGTLSPLSAKDILERFWASGETSWDACFDQPYMFMMQPAVDVSQLP